MKFKRIVFISSLVTILLQASEPWIDPSHGTIDHKYIGAPGMFSSEAQFAKLTPQFTASTGEIIRCDRGIITVPESVTVANLAEISPRSSTQKEVLACAQKAAITVPLCALALALRHTGNSDTSTLSTALAGIGVMGCLGYTLWRPVNFLLSHRANQKFGITFEPAGNDTSIRHHAINLFKVNVAQDDDVGMYIASLDKILSTASPEKPSKLILYGVSRGSATVFESFAQLDAQGEGGAIGAVVCEGIFDSVANIAQNAPWKQKIKLCALMGLGVTRFKKDGMSPLAMLDKINDKSKPIALITSRADQEVPYQNTFNLYTKLRQRGHNNAHILILDHSSHNTYPLGDEKEKYQSFIHAFYRKYDLPHIARFADEGQEYLRMSQPAIE